MLKTTVFFLLLYLTATICKAQKFIVTDSSEFKCYYKIYFLGKTAEYGEHISYSSNQNPDTMASGKVVMDTVTVDSFLIGDMGRFVGDSMINDTAAEVVVKSCDGKKKYEIEKTVLEYFIYKYGYVSPLTFASAGSFINLQKSFAVHNEFERMTIVLKGVPEPLYLYIMIGIDPPK